MAEVLSPQADGQSPLYSPHHRRTPSPPSSTFRISSHPAAAKSTSTLTTPPAPPQPSLLRGYASTPSLSSHTSTSDLANLLSSSSPSSTNTSASSIEDKYTRECDFDDAFPHYNLLDHKEEEEEAEDDEVEEPVDTTSTGTTASDSPLPTPTVADDTAIQREPSQHVDYLSHNWKEEDVWSSWRHIVSQRRVYGQQSRLENAAWRTWIKNKYQLRTVSPETLNWLKESDVTWLYGPLKPALTHPLSQPDSAPESNLSKSNSFIHKKPILKKRSMSEVMLQRSISTSSLVKQAAASVQAQGRQTRRSIMSTSSSAFLASGMLSEPPSREGRASVASSKNSGERTPSEGKERKHIRFDNTVEQCIAVEAKPEEYDEDEEFDAERGEGDEQTDGANARWSLSSDSSDEGVVMMKRARRPTLAARRSSGGGGGGKASRSSSHNGRKTIETLPSTTLKYRTDSPELSEEQQQAALSRIWGRSRRLSPSASQETLRPTRPSRNFLLGAEDEEGEEDEYGIADAVHNGGDDASWSFASNNPRSSLGAAGHSSTASRRDGTPGPQSRHSGYDPQWDSHDVQGSQHGQDADSDSYNVEGMRRTESGMFMPYDDEDEAMARGLFGRISETVNTARDIAHVIWNVGWRK